MYIIGFVLPIIEPKKYKPNEVKIIPTVVPIMIFLEAIPVRASKQAHIKTARVDVSPNEPGTVPINRENQLKSTASDTPPKTFS